jgi:hypothetical protein
VFGKIIGEKKSLFVASEHFVFDGFLVGAKGAVNNPAPQNDNIYSCRKSQGAHSCTLSCHIKCGRVT